MPIKKNTRSSFQLEKQTWQKIDELAQAKVNWYLNNVFRTSQIQLSDLNLAKNPNYRFAFENQQKCLKSDGNYYLVLEHYQTGNCQALEYEAQKIAYEFLLMAIKSLLWYLRLLPFHKQEHFNQLFNEKHY